jgi:arylsulfatase A-like enzyme
MQPVNRRSFLQLAAGASVGAMGLGSACLAQTAARGPIPGSGEKPNIIWIMADDMGYGDAGVYGQKLIKTPNIDKLASEGTRFTQVYAGAPVCAPSRCCLMTGYHTGHAVIRGNSKQSLKASPADTTVAEVLKQAGYATALVGKWGLGGEGQPGVPTKKGFDFFYGFIDQTMAHNSYPSFLVRNEERIKLRNVVPNEGQYGQGVASEKVDFANALMQEQALQYIDQNKSHTFFLYYSPTLPHANNEAHEVEVPDLGIYKETDWPDAQKKYAAAVTLMDAYVGQIMDHLKQAGIDRNTIVFFTSDNGPHEEGGNSASFFKSSGVLRGMKRDVYEGGIRAPMIVRWPGKVPSGKVSDQVWAFWDFLPTAAQLAGAKAPEGIDGISMLPAIVGQRQPQQHEYLYWEFHELGFKQGIRMGDWKAVKLGVGAPVELYDLAHDAGETRNIAADHPDIVAKMTPLFTSARVDSPDWPIGSR